VFWIELLFRDKIGKKIIGIKIYLIKNKDIKKYILETILQWISKISKQKVCITKKFIIYYF
jgi:hypothetical protein